MVVNLSYLAFRDRFRRWFLILSSNPCSELTKQIIFDFKHPNNSLFRQITHSAQQYLGYFGIFGATRGPDLKSGAAQAICSFHIKVIMHFTCSMRRAFKSKPKNPLAHGPSRPVDLGGLEVLLVRSGGPDLRSGLRRPFVDFIYTFLCISLVP